MGVWQLAKVSCLQYNLSEKWGRKKEKNPSPHKNKILLDYIFIIHSLAVKHISGRGYEKIYMVSVCASLIIFIWKGRLSLLLHLHHPIVLILCCSCKSISAKRISIHHLAYISEEALAKKVIWLSKSMLFCSC